ncbi:unnamed protein product [Caenorhabditis angaria]|uniref:Peptidase S1 domain-containing protein n=1 Tax=Caenorhabditis angaria TaxID=860376 RepID=A0A9P1IYZ5_9PELO|nr:unnamed protein product [Caenorhabditis angaria]
MTDSNNNTGHPIHLHPWATLIQIHPTGKDEGVICGGTLITKKHVASAAHCFQQKFLDTSNGGHKRYCDADAKYSEEEIIRRTTLTIGAICTNLDKDVGCTYKEQLGRQYRIKNMLFADFYKNNCVNGDDIVIIELDQEIDESTVSNYACLPFEIEEVKDNSTVTSFGWGTDPGKAYDKKPYPFLQTVSLTKSSHAECKSSRGGVIPSDSFCTVEEEDKNVCAGDSGGGLMRQYKKQHYISAIISYGTDCSQLIKGVTPKNQVNTSIRYHQKLITDFINKK